LLDADYFPSDPEFQRLGSLEFTGGWIEEAGEIQFLAYDNLKTTAGRWKNKEYNLPAKTFLTFNPSKNFLYREFYKPFKERILPPNLAFIQALYKDNRYTAKEVEHQLNLITDKTTRERLKFGNWEYEDDPAIMINYDAIADLFTNTIDKSTEKYLVVDAARYGRDFTVFSFWKGLEWYRTVYKQKQGLEVTEEDIRTYAHDEQIPFSHILVDEDGIGGGIIDHLRGIKGFVANRPSTLDPITEKPQNFKNIKAQCAYLLADKVNNHLIAVKGMDEKAKDMLIADLEQIKTLNADKDSKKQIVSKEEMKEHLGRSPDFGDCALMRMWFELKKVIEHKEYTQKAYEPISPYEVPQIQIISPRRGIYGDYGASSEYEQPLMKKEL
jgi:hypothetical protein